MSIVPGTEEPGVCPPVIDPSISEGKQNRARLLRAWVEMSAWLTIYQKNKTNAFGTYKPQVLNVHART